MYSWRVGTQFLLRLVISHLLPPQLTPTPSVSAEASAQILEIGTWEAERLQMKSLTVSFIGWKTKVAPDQCWFAGGK